MMVRLVLIYVLLGIVSAVSAQGDPVLMRINGKEISRSEFEYYYNKSASKTASARRKALNEYADSFINFRLKVAAAEAEGLDTVPAFLKERDDCRRRLIRFYLTDMEVASLDARKLYDRMRSEHRAGQVLVKQIFKFLPQNISGYAMREVEHKMDSVFLKLEKENSTEAFDACANLFSDDKRTFRVSRTQMPIEFEDAVFGLQAGEISPPFFTPQGIHIVKVLERKELPSFEEMKSGIIHRQIRRYGTGKATQAIVEKLKKEYRYTPDKSGMDELLSKGNTHRTLFTLDGKPYSGKDFARFAVTHPAGIRRQVESFVTKTVLDYENGRLEQRHPEFRMLMRDYCDSLLLAAITHREIEEKKMKDEAGLKTYFETHRSDFHWEESRYRGIVLHCATKRIAKQARKFLKKLPEAEWKDAVRLTFNAGGKTLIQAEQGLFAPGDNIYVDDLVFKRGDATPVLSYPFTIVLGKKQKGPDNWQEVREPLSVAYRDYLETHWVAKLRSSAKVEIDQEVLKTVNNH